MSNRMPDERTGRSPTAAFAGPERRAQPRPVAPTVTPAVRRRVLARTSRVILLALGDLAALLASGALAYVLWALPERGQHAALYLRLAPLLPLFSVGYAVAGLYPGRGLGPIEILRRQSYVTAFGFLVLAAFSFVLKLPHLYSRVTFTLALVFAMLFVPLTRALIRQVASRWSWWLEPVVIIGSGERALRAVNGLKHALHIGYRATAVLTLEGRAAQSIEGVPVIGDLSQSRLAIAQGIRVALLETDRVEDRRLIDRLQQEFRHVVLLRNFDDLPVERLHVRNFGQFVGIEYTNNLARRGNRAVKRALDAGIAALGLVIAAPVVLLAAALVRVIDGAPAFFFQSRTGLFGRRLVVPKIRTMRQDAEQRLAEHLEKDELLRDEWREHQKLRNDPRLIPVIGRLLRRFSIDELPQLWTVLKGQMSLVGPRPLPDYHMQMFSPDFVELRRRVRPGITGLWQISVRSEGGVKEQEAYDSYYIRNWSVWLDVYVLSRTIGAVFSGRGAY